VKERDHGGALKKGPPSVSVSRGARRGTSAAAGMGKGIEGVRRRGKTWEFH